MDILTELCSLPTAPFAERQVVAYIERFVQARRKLRLRRDRFGNLLIELRGRARGPRWVFAAHMDHPGFIAQKMVDERTLEAAFHGGVLPEYLDGQRVRFFTDAGEVPATVQSYTMEDERRRRPTSVRLSVERDVPSGAPGMFDQGAGRLEGGRFVSRVCDDLAGAAGALAMLNDLCAVPPQAPVAVLLTRAEEEGFIGAIGAALHPELLKKSDRIIAIECSAEQPYAPLGGGAIIRIGDRTSVFNSDLCYFITHQAEALAKLDPSFRFQRALMPGGTCEATVYDVYGYMAGSICVPLGNYHNMNRQEKRIGPEYIDFADWQNMVKLFIHLARTGHLHRPGHALLKQSLQERFDQFAHLL
jgi:putative aminopeptidase FrvX